MDTLQIRKELRDRSPKLLIWSIIVFVISLLWIGTINLRTEALMKERDALYSWTSVLTSSAQAFLDGFTFGAFREDGIFAELEELEREENSLSWRATWLKVEFS
jgi:hypothetical protein